MKKKGQAAMEFLMTYGWAILVVVAAIAVLAASGILNLSGFLPEKCQFPVEMSCVGGKAAILQENSATSSSTITIPLRNSIGYKANIIDAEMVNDEGTEVCASGGNPQIQNAGNLTTGDWDDLDGTPREVANEEVFRIRFQDCGFGENEIGSKFIGTATVTYENQESGIELPAVGDISGRIA